MIRKLFNNLDASPCNFFAAERVTQILDKAGFTHLDEYGKWDIKVGGKYYVTRNQSSVMAFVVGKNNAYNIVAAHTDSPCFKIKLNSDMTVSAYSKLNVEVYGGGIFSTWLDRALGIAGRIIVSDRDGNLCSRLVNPDIKVMIPNLAIHMNRAANEGVKLNAQTDMCPVIGLDGVKFADIIADSLAEGESVVDYDLYLYNADKAFRWGAKEEFIASSRLDDLEGIFGGIEAITSAHSDNTMIMAAYDNEEVGSRTKQGAGSTFLKEIIGRINTAMGRGKEDKYVALANSMLVSMDNAHAKHPNHPELNDPTNNVVIGGGIVIKHHANQNYTTDAVSSAIIKQIFARAGVKYQDFFMRSDMPCGGTLGAISSAQVSITSVDIGLAQWAMHSSMEEAGADDYVQLVGGLRAFFESNISRSGDKISIK